MKRLRITNGSRIVASRQDNVWYRCVPHNANVLHFKPHELGIHCGSLAQAKLFNTNKYQGKGDIYKITLQSSVKYSNTISDHEYSWNDVDAISDILASGFGLDYSASDVLSDYRNGKYDKHNVSPYITEKTGVDAVVVYKNEVEVSEVDIIILDTMCIQSYHIF